MNTNLLIFIIIRGNLYHLYLYFYRPNISS